MFQPLSLEKRQEWEERIRIQKESGQTIARWCREQNVTYSSFMYWKERFNLSPVLSRSSFREVSDCSEKTGISIEYRGVHIALSKNFDSATLIQCLRVCRESLC
jgi:hypothetical protein